MLVGSILADLVCEEDADAVLDCASYVAEIDYIVGPCFDPILHRG